MQVEDHQHFAMWSEAMPDQECSLMGCTAKAEWMGWAAHTAPCCPNTSPVCDDHRRQIVEWWERRLEDNPLCVRCMTRIVGVLSDYVRFAPL